MLFMSHPSILLQIKQYMRTPSISMDVDINGAAECAGSRLSLFKIIGIRAPNIIEVMTIIKRDNETAKAPVTSP